MTKQKCKISFIPFWRCLPNYTLAVCVTCHHSHSVLLSSQQRRLTAVVFLCKSYPPLAQSPSPQSACLIEPTDVSAGITESMNPTDRGLTECHPASSCCLNIKQLSVAGGDARYDLLSKCHPYLRGCALILRFSTPKSCDFNLNTTGKLKHTHAGNSNNTRS